MWTSRRSALVPLLVMVSLALAGCPKQPMHRMDSAAPAPRSAGARTPPATTVRPASNPAATGLSSGARAVPATPSSTPPPSAFRAVDALKDVHFEFDRYDIRPEDGRILDGNASWLRLHPRALVLIEGHCDSRGTTAYNLSLGDRRAKATMNYLLAHGVGASRITTISYGEERPLCTEESEGCWARNRRAHLLVKEN